MKTSHAIGYRKGASARRRWIVAAAAALALAGASSAAAAISLPVLTLDEFADDHSPAASSRPADNLDLTLIPLEDLMNIEITSVTKQKQRISDAAAAISVITQEDIRRSGMNSIVELLRMVPGMTVAQVGANQWAVGSRGMNAVFNSNLLVLMDGRTIYNPLFSGVYWDTADYILADLDRIEVIRGPGATLWGANAVNGVINIVSKSAKDTQGVYAREYAGSDGYQSDLRYGGKVDDRLYYRAYAKYRSQNNFEFSDGSNAEDGWDSPRGGFRVDAYPTGQDTVTVQGDIFTERLGNRYHFGVDEPPYVRRTGTIDNASGSNILARWTHTISETSDFSVQMFYDRLNYTSPKIDYKQDKFDIEVQHRFNLAEFNEIVWGVGYRFASDSVTTVWDGDQGTWFSPAARQTDMYSGFVQDDITLIPKRLHAIAGIKVEHNIFSGWEFQPSARMVYTPDDRNTVWAGVSRAVLTPGRFEENGGIIGSGNTPSGLPLITVMRPNRSLSSEKITAFEAGYRVEAMKNLTFDLAGFYNLHDGLRAYEAGTPSMVYSPSPHLVIPLVPHNDLDGSSYGAELSTRWRVTDSWQLAAAYSYVGVNMHSRSGRGTATTLRAAEYTTPTNQFNVRSYWNITRDIELNNALYIVDNTPGTAGTEIPAYIRADVNLVWRPEKHVDLTIGVRNIFDSGHPEFSILTARPSNGEVPRTFFVQMDVRF
jgi:iron complex outermembrane recepter protein